jgi:hypothetical protein
MGQDDDQEDDCQRSPYDDHAAIAFCWPSTSAIFRQPSILRYLICPLATRLKSRTTAASSVGSEPCVFTRSLEFFVAPLDHVRLQFSLGAIDHVDGTLQTRRPQLVPHLGPGRGPKRKQEGRYTRLEHCD